MQPTQPQRSRFAELISGIPAATRLVIVLNVSVWIYTFFYPNIWWTYQICPNSVLIRNEWWRIVTAAFFHGGTIHLLMNMMTFFYLGLRLESKFGTLCFIGLNLLINLFSGIMYVVAGYVLAATKLHSTGCAVGYSGVIFGFIVIDCKLSTSPHRNVFGFCQVPVWCYPWVMLCLLSIMLPNVSFVGHLSGLLVGWLYTLGYFDFLTLKLERVRTFEDREGLFRSIVNRTSYQQCPVDPVIRHERSTGIFSPITSILDRPRRYWESWSRGQPQQTADYEPLSRAAGVDHQISMEMDPNANSRPNLALPVGAPLGRPYTQPSAPPQQTAVSNSQYPPSPASSRNPNPSAPEETIAGAAVETKAEDFDSDDIQAAIEKSLQDK